MGISYPATMTRLRRTWNWSDDTWMGREGWPYYDGSRGDDPVRVVCFGHDAGSAGGIFW